MPIEDVDYLKQNSQKQSYIFLVNSKDRNKEAYPTPSEYVVDFSQLFYNVIGLMYWMHPSHEPCTILINTIIQFTFIFIRPTKIYPKSLQVSL